MTPTDDTRALWRRLQAHPMAFAARLEQEQGWSRIEALEAIEEYRRFVFLACTGENEATPSDAVDAVWHAHLLHTRDYWIVFCPQVLRQSLHHSPGGPGERARHDAQYLATLARYEAVFGEPPPSRWWPLRQAPTARSARWRFAPAAAVLMPAVAWAAVRPANPLDWTGGEFLLLYVALMVAVFVASPILRAWLRRQGEQTRDAGKLSTLDIAYLAGGAERAIDAAAAELHHRGAVAWDSGTRRFVTRNSRHSLPSELVPFETALVCAGSGAAAVKAAGGATHRVRDALERRGLWQRADDARRIGRITAVPSAALLAFGLVKIAVGVQRERPVTALAVLCAIVAIAALVYWLGNSPVPTRAGKAALERHRAAHRAAKTGRGLGDVGLAVALGGTALLADTALAGYHQMRAPPSSSSSDSSSSSGSDSSSDSGDSGGGSSCGGCGGGGGGD
jgi:uncharacterized protein (TIGR04222 family)